MKKYYCRSIPTRGVDRLRDAFITLGKSGAIGANAGSKFLLCWLMAAIKNNLIDAISYTLPTFTLRDHLKDCFGWLYGEVSP